MNKFLTFALILIATLSSTTMTAQQDPLYSQHMFNKLPLNPAYAGSTDAISATALYRRQLIGTPGAPYTGTVSLHSPLANRKLAIGMNVTLDQYGSTNSTAVSSQFAYRIPTNEGHLSFGLQASVNKLSASPTSAIGGADIDPSLMADVNGYMGNAGAGIYYNTESYYIGASVPSLIENKLSDGQSGDEIAEQSRQYFAMGGYVFDINRTVKVRPTALVRYVENAPIQADLGVAVLLQEKVWVGGQYRTMGAMDVIVEYQATESIRLGYTYGQQIDAIGISNNGSHELMVGFDFATKSSRKPKKGSILCYF